MLGYGKIFRQIYAGTLRANWKALVTFEQMIVLCDPDGTIDMPPEVLHNITGIPLDIILDGIRALESPDPRSRSPEQGGRRIVRLDDHRDWGWQIVNHEFYKNLSSRSEQRDKTRNRVRRFRERKRKEPAAGVTTCNDCNGTHTHTQTHINTYTDSPEPHGSGLVIAIPLNDKSEYPIYQEQVNEFAALYPAVDVMQALRDMRGWCIANPTKRKTNGGVLRFVNRWLSKEQNSGGKNHETGRQSGKPSLAERASEARRQFERTSATEQRPDGEPVGTHEPHLRTPVRGNLRRVGS